MTQQLTQAINKLWNLYEQVLNEGMSEGEFFALSLGEGRLLDQLASAYFDAERENADILQEVMPNQFGKTYEEVIEGFFQSLDQFGGADLYNPGGDRLIDQRIDKILDSMDIEIVIEVNQLDYAIQALQGIYDDVVEGRIDEDQFFEQALESNLSNIDSHMLDELVTAYYHDLAQNPDIMSEIMPGSDGKSYREVLEQFFEYLVHYDGAQELYIPGGTREIDQRIDKIVDALDLDLPFTDEQEGMGDPIIEQDDPIIMMEEELELEMHDDAFLSSANSRFITDNDDYIAPEVIDFLAGESLTPSAQTLKMVLVNEVNETSDEAVLASCNFCDDEEIGLASDETFNFELLEAYQDVA